MKSDREKWDKRYRVADTDVSDPDSLLLHGPRLSGPGRALDVACGRGANALFVAARGFQVDAVDISLAALRVVHATARQRDADVACIAADLDYFPLPISVYDLVLVFYFFSEPLILPIERALKPGGLLCYATYNVRHTSVKPGFNPAYLIEPDDLRRHFADFEHILHESDAGEKGNVSRLIARRPLDHF